MVQDAPLVSKINEVAGRLKSDALTAMVVGCVVELSIWLRVYLADLDPLTAGRYRWLEWLQEPGEKSAYFVAGLIAKNPVMLYSASAFGIAVLIGLWSVAAFTVLRIVKHLYH